MKKQNDFCFASPFLFGGIDKYNFSFAMFKQQLSLSIVLPSHKLKVVLKEKQIWQYGTLSRSAVCARRSTEISRSSDKSVFERQICLSIYWLLFDLLISKITLQKGERVLWSAFRASLTWGFSAILQVSTAGFANPPYGSGSVF